MQINSIEIALKEVALPDGISLYEVAGQTIFPIYGPAGLNASSYACLIRKEAGKWFGSGIEITLEDDAEAAKTKIVEALSRFVEFDADGGALPPASDEGTTPWAV